MKKIFYTLVAVLTAVFYAAGQAPQAINYQAVARDSAGAILTNRNISVRITILEDSAAGPSIYQEVHNPECNSFGLINLFIGTGTAISGDFTSISWADSEYFLKVEMDPDAGNNFHDFCTSKIVSVPYALEARHGSSLTLTDENGIKYDVEVDTNGSITTNRITWLCGDSLIDTRDGQIYSTVQIGSQCWMAENLNIGTKINSTSGGQQQTDNGIIEKYCYNNEEDSCNVYGGLYEWNEAMQYVTTEGAQGICPDSWHIPTDSEWTILTDYLGGSSVAGGKMKSTGTIEAGTGLWHSPNTGATNESGFTGLPGGYRSSDSGPFYVLGYHSLFWSSSQYDVSYAWSRYLSYDIASLSPHFDDKGHGFSVRCLKDN